MREFINIVERYGPDLSYFRNYMRDAEFDPYSQWYVVCEWLLDNYAEEIQEMTGQEFTDAHDLNDAVEPDLFYKLPKDIQEICAKAVSEYVMQHNPADAPTQQHMQLSQERLLHRQTWLVHFSDHAEDISLNGFKYGVDQMDRLGLTHYLPTYEKGAPGFNFAFEASSRDAAFGASNGKYGRDAVLFQSSGVRCYHFGDEENQIVFYGPNVDPESIILLRNDKDSDEWRIIPKKDIKNRKYLFSGTYSACIAWVQTNSDQYRHHL